VNRHRRRAASREPLDSTDSFVEDAAMFVQRRVSRPLSFLVALLLGASAEAGAPCSAPEAKQFDFWVGEWKVRWDATSAGDPGGTGHNRIAMILDGCVIEENFSTDEAQPLVGHSVSVWSPQRRRWLQTWVDNQGSYLDFTGEFKDGKMILARQGLDGKGEAISQRMIFENIAADRFDWRWEAARGGGEWKLAWHLHYERVK
jgi:hypothetical protein